MAERDQDEADKKTDAPSDRIERIRAEYEKGARGGERFYSWFPIIFTTAFGLLSFLGTWVGLRDIINLGDLRAGFLGEVMVFLLVALATMVMIYALRRFAANIFSWAGAGFLVMYLGLAFFSVTFGFAFYWGRLEARQQAVGGALEKLEAFEDRAKITRVALDNTVQSLTALEVTFRELAETEAREGGTCGDGSGRGEGPRMRHRLRRADEISSRVAQLRPAFDRVEPLFVDLAARMAAVKALGQEDAEEAGGERRRSVFTDARAQTRIVAQEINALAQDRVIASAADVFRRWGDEYKDPALVRTDDPRGERYKCFRQDAGDALTGAAERLERLPVVAAPNLPAYADAAATAEAVNRMLFSSAALFGFGGRPSSVDLEACAGVKPGQLSEQAEAELRKICARSIVERPPVAAASAGGAGGEAAFASVTPRGLIADDARPLAIAIIVDALLFFFTMLDRPGMERFERFKRNIREAMEDAFNPIHIVELRQQLDDEEAWRALVSYRFDIDDEVYFAIPTNLSRFEDGEQLHDVFKLWRLNGIVVEDAMPADQALRHLEAAGRDELLATLEVLEGEGDKTEFVVYRLTSRAYHQMLLRSLFRGLPAPRGQDAQGFPARGPGAGLLGGLRQWWRRVRPGRRPSEPPPSGANGAGADEPGAQA